MRPIQNQKTGTSKSGLTPPHTSPSYPTLPQKSKDLATDKIWCLAKIKKLGQLLLLRVLPHPSPAYPNPAYPRLPQPTSS